MRCLRNLRALSSMLVPVAVVAGAVSLSDCKPSVGKEQSRRMGNQNAHLPAATKNLRNRNDTPRYLVPLKGKWGYIDANGKMVIPPHFDLAYPFSDGMARVNMGFSCERGGGLWGYIDPDGKWAVMPRFPAAGDFSEGLAPVGIGSTVLRYG